MSRVIFLAALFASFHLAAIAAPPQVSRPPAVERETALDGAERPPPTVRRRMLSVDAPSPEQAVKAAVNARGAGLKAPPAPVPLTGRLDADGRVVFSHDALAPAKDSPERLDLPTPESPR